MSALVIWSAMMALALIVIVVASEDDTPWPG